MKQVITQWLYMEFDTHALPNGDYDWGSDKRWAPVIYRFKADDTEDRVLVRAMQIEVDVPSDFDPTARQIAALEAKKEKARKAYVDMVREIDERISKLQAITYRPAESSL